MDQTKLSPSAVAKRWGVGKTTIYRMMKDGEISFETNSIGKRELDLSEVVRVLGEPKVRGEVSSSEQNVLAVQVLREQIERQDKSHNEHIKSLQTQISSYQEQVNKLLENQADSTKLLMHLQAAVGSKPPESVQPEEVPPTVESAKAEQPQQAKRKKSFLSRILAAAIDD